MSWSAVSLVAVRIVSWVVSSWRMVRCDARRCRRAAMSAPYSSSPARRARFVSSAGLVFVASCVAVSANQRLLVIERDPHEGLTAGLAVGDEGVEPFASRGERGVGPSLLGGTLGRPGLEGWLLGEELAHGLAITRGRRHKPLQLGDHRDVGDDPPAVPAMLRSGPPRRPP